MFLSDKAIFTGRNEVVAKVMFLLVCVILFPGGGVCLSACCDTPPPEGDTPRDHAPPLPRSQSMLGDTVNARPVRILLECNLVKLKIQLP